jgi:hypothetical protein
MTMTKSKLCSEENLERLHLGNACHHSVQNCSPSHLLCKNIKIKIYKGIILPLVLCACEALSLRLKEEHRLRVLENRVLRRTFRLRRAEVAES